MTMSVAFILLSVMAVRKAKSRKRVPKAGNAAQETINIKRIDASSDVNNEISYKSSTG